MSQHDNEVTVDWTTAIIVVSVEVQHTATRERQAITIPLPEFAAMLLDLGSKRIRQAMVDCAADRARFAGETLKRKLEDGDE